MHPDNTSALANRPALLTHLNTTQYDDQALSHGYLAVITVENMPEMETTYSPGVSGEVIRQRSTRLLNRQKVTLQTYRINTHQLATTFPAISDGSIEKRLSRLNDVFNLPFHFDTLSIHGDISAGYMALPGKNKGP